MNLLPDNLQGDGCKDMPALFRFPIVGVMGSGSHSHRKRATLLGEWLATLNVHLLTGGGQGVMAAVSHAFYHVENRKGLVLGILPCRKDQASAPPSGYPNKWVELPIVTHLPFSGTRGTDPLSRNHINVLTATVVIALPGGMGTVSEVTLARQYGRPVAAFLNSEEALAMPGLPEDILITDNFNHLKKWISRSVGPRRQGESPHSTGG